MNADPSRRVREGEMTPFQIMAVGICLVINMLDGFDVLAISFAAPEIAREWSVAPADLGILFSAGLVGMTLGSLFIAPFADRYGRRFMILLCLVIISGGMFASAIAQTVWQLAAMRIVTGLGIGGMLASLNTIVAEYSSDRRRQLAVSILQVGYPVGAMLAGVVSAYLLVAFGWRSVFVVGGVLPALMFPVVYWRLPESLDYLMQRGSAGALGEVNGLLAKLGQPALAELPQPASMRNAGARLTDILSPALRRQTLLVWLAYIVVMFCWYFVVNWTPKILVDEGLGLGLGISGGVLINLGGVAGGLALGIFATRRIIGRLVAGYMMLAAAAMTLFGLAVAGSLLLVAFAIGFFLAGAMVGLYTIVPEIYPPAVRTTGTGWAVGIGRIGAVAGPYVAGLLIAQGWQRALYYFVLALPLLVSTIAILRLRGIRAANEQ